MLRRTNGARAEVPTSSMADIAFLLLIFFLVTTVFDEERGLPLTLPPDGELVDVPPENMLILDVRADGIVSVRRGESEREQRVMVRELPDIWRYAVSTNPLMIAAVRTQPDAPYHYMIDVLDALRSAGAERISLQVGQQE